MKCGKDCKFFNEIANTDECICSKYHSFELVPIGMDCPLEPKPYRCGDCVHFIEGDYACMTAKADDIVNGCPGFIDDRYYQMALTIADWIKRGLNYEEMVANAVAEGEILAK